MRPWWLRPAADDDGPNEAESTAPTDKKKQDPPATSESADAQAEEGTDQQKPEATPKRASRSRRKPAGRKSAQKKQDDAPKPPRESPKRSRRKSKDKPLATVEEIETLVVSAPERTESVSSEENRLALFCDLENVALGVRDSDIKKFELSLVLERLVEKGRIIVKKAYCDWERYSEFKRPFHEASVEMIDIPQKYYSGKNSADIKMVVDAMEICYSKDHVDTFVILSGDSDFTPLVSKLREANKRVIGVGVKNSSSALLVDSCDEFLFYEDVWRDSQKAPTVSGIDKKHAEAFSLMIDSMKALMREDKEILWGSMIKQTMKRKRPSFNEGYHGYSTFSEMLEDAERKNLVRLKRDKRSGSYIVTGFANGR